MKYIPYDTRFNFLPGGFTRYGNYYGYKFDNRKKIFKSVYFSHKNKPLPGDETGLSERQAWVGLERAWVAFKAYRKAGNKEMMSKYANIINVLKGKLGLDPTYFYNLP